MTKYRYIIIALFLYVFILALVTTMFNYYYISNRLTYYLLCFGVSGNFIVAVFLSQKVINEQSIKDVFDKQVDALNNLNSLINFLRSERHDYLNHLQVLSGLLGLKKVSAAEEYMEELVVGIRTNSSLLAIKDPVVIALLQSKYNQAEEKNIQMLFDISSDLKDLAVKKTDITVILSNLLNNALDAVAKLEQSQRYVMVSIFDNDSQYSISVINSGPSISEEEIEKIFQEEYSTKGSGRGYGLSLVTAALKRNNGSIKVSANPTNFTVKLPKGNKNDQENIPAN